MTRIVRVKNASGADGTWAGQTIVAGEYYDLTNADLIKWPKKPLVFADIGNGNLVVCKGANMVDDVTDPVAAWNWLADSQEFPLSDLDGTKLAVHASSKPLNTNTTIYALWIGAGDDITTGEIAGGDLAEFSLTPGVAKHDVDLKFKSSNGKVWLHEGYLRFENGGSGDYIEATVMAEATPLQTVVNLDLEISGDVVSYAAGGPGTGTHGFADADMVVLTPRTFSRDGEWDYDGMSLTPNATNTGSYRITTSQQIVHRFMHRIPTRGTSGTYFTMGSEESTLLPDHYFLRITAHNVSDTTWNATSIIEVYRERSYNP